jgi:Rha family phage regulatory protein
MDLVETRKGEIYCDSSVVSRKLGQKHNEVVKRIAKLCEDLRGVSNSPKIPILEERNYRGRDYTAYLMTREFFSLLAMRFQGGKALEWQVKFNNAFYAMEKMLLLEATNKQNDKWITDRDHGKQIRIETTDIIKDFVDYATNQGSKSAKFYYKHVTQATYKALGLLTLKEPTIRNTLDIYELSQLSTAEQLVQRSFKKHMKDEIPYKIIYKYVVRDLGLFSDSLLLDT